MSHLPASGSDKVNIEAEFYTATAEVSAVKTLNLDCKISRFECDFGIYKDLSLPMIMLQGWV